MNPVAKLLTSIFQSSAQREQRAVIESLQKEHKRAVRRLEEMYDDALSDWQRELDEIRANSLAGSAGARKDGDSWPLLVNMEDLNRYRAESREVCDGNGYGAGMLDRAIDFVIGDGMQPEVTLRGAKKGAVSTGVADADGDGRPDADAAVVNVQAVIDEFRRLNDWGMGEEDREEEGFRRSQRDAEVGVRFFAGGAKTNGIPRVRWFEPEQLDTPPSAMPNERWGIRTDPDDVEDKQAYYLKRIDGTGGEWVDAGEICWHKLGTDRTVLRGMPQFWLVAKALRQAEALNSAVAEVSAIQARIAYVREHAAGIMPGQITDFVGGQGDATTRKRTPYGDNYRRVGITEEGTTVDMSSGMKFTAGPVSQGVPAFVQALQSRLRQVCARFGYPEFFTGDASNGNYASLLAAGGPAERAFKRRQMKYAAFQACVYRKACEYAVQAGRLSAADLAAVDIKVKPGGVAVSNKLEEAQVQQIRIQNKILSPQTAMMQNGEDPRVEMANIKAYDDQFGMGAMGLGGGQGDQLLEPAVGMNESYTADEYELLSEAARAGLVLTQVGTHPRTGNPIMRYTRPKQAAPNKAAVVAQSKQTATQLVRDGVKTPAQARQLADALKQLTAKDIDALKAEFDLRMKGRLKQDKVDTLVAYAQGRGSVTGATPPTPPAAPAAKTPAEPKPTRQPKADKPEPTAALPAVKPGAAQNPDDADYVAAGREMLADDGFRKDFADAYNNLTLFVEFSDGLVELPRLYSELKKKRPSLTLDQFHAALDQVSRDRQAEKHVLNEVMTAPDAKNQGSIERNGRLYHYVRFVHGGRGANADHEQMKPKG